MNESMRELGQRAVAAGFDQLRVLNATAAALSGTVQEIDELQAQLAGLRLQVINEASIRGLGEVLDLVLGSVRVTPSAGRASIRLAHDLAESYALIGAGLCEGTLSQAQAVAIVDGLRHLPPTLARGEVHGCQETLLSFAGELDPNQLRHLAAHLYEVIAPEAAEAEEAARLERQARQARAARSLRFRPDHHGSTILTGQLPTADAALIQAQLEALLPSKASYAENGEAPAPDARRADALVLLAAQAAAAGSLPAKGGDRPHLHITMPLSFLTEGLGMAQLIGPGQETLNPGEARRMACDAGIIPTVLGSRSVLLDLGHEHRLVPAELRAALTARDQGCVFPSCEAPAASCDAHHVQPWWAGGATSLANTMLLCPFHHRLVEPDPGQSPQSQWRAFIDPATGRATFLPPTHIDPQRKPRQHRRYRVGDILETLDIPTARNTAPPTTGPEPTSTPPPATPPPSAGQTPTTGPEPMSGPEYPAAPTRPQDDPWYPYGLTAGQPPARPGPVGTRTVEDPWGPYGGKPDDVCLREYADTS